MRSDPLNAACSLPISFSTVHQVAASLSSASPKPSGEPHSQSTIYTDYLPLNVQLLIGAPCPCPQQPRSYSALAGLVPTQGLYSNAVAPIPSALTQSSRYLQTGCMAVCALVTGGALTALGVPSGTPMFAALASMLVRAAGVAEGSP